MRIMDVEQWFALAEEQRCPMVAWFEAVKSPWEHGVAFIERLCGVTLLYQVAGSDGSLRFYDLGEKGVVVPTRPVRVLSEAPFPWPDGWPDAP